MRITRSTDAPSGALDLSHFHGAVSSRDYGPLEAPRGTALIVSFPAGARTHWHRHPGGQVLFVTEGSGRVGTRDDGPEALRPGDLVYAPPNEEHWHGASEPEGVSHLALSFGDTEWLEPVEE
jgi:quercetin dioxygenase-like cupin family protein